MTFRGDAARHEREAVTVPLAEFGDDADAIQKADDAIALAQVAELAACRALVVDDDGGVHALALDLEPAAAVADPRVVITRGIEIVGRAAVDGSGLERGILLAARAAAQGEKFFEELLHHAGFGGGDAHLKAGVVVVRAADGELDDLEARTVLHDGVEDLGHQP